MGYAEAKDKNSFMVGSDIAFSKAENYYEKVIQHLESQLNLSNLRLDEALGDFDTIINIFDKYKK